MIRCQLCARNCTIAEGERAEFAPDGFGAALVAYERALETASDPVQQYYAHSLLGRVLSKLGRQREAVRHYEAVLAAPSEVTDEYGIALWSYAAASVQEANARQDVLVRVEAEMDAALSRIQNDLFDLGADLCTPDHGVKLEWEPLRISQDQVVRLENEIDDLNGELAPLRSFVLPGGHGAAAALHVCRTVARRAERRMVELSALPDELVSAPALRYVNRLSDFLFVASRWVNARLDGDVLWVPGANR